MLRFCPFLLKTTDRLRVQEFTIFAIFDIKTTEFSTFSTFSLKTTEFTTFRPLSPLFHWPSRFYGSHPSDSHSAVNPHWTDLLTAILQWIPTGPLAGRDLSCMSEESTSRTGICRVCLRSGPARTHTTGYPTRSTHPPYPHTRVHPTTDLARVHHPLPPLLHWDQPARLL